MPFWSDDMKESFVSSNEFCSHLLHIVGMLGRDILVPTVVPCLLILCRGLVVTGRHGGRGVDTVFPGVRPVGGGAVTSLIVPSLVTFKGSPRVVTDQFLVPRRRRDPAGRGVSGPCGLFVASVCRSLVMLVRMRCMSALMLVRFTLRLRRPRLLFRSNCHSS
jgi:hypothetical protein